MPNRLPPTLSYILSDKQLSRSMLNNPLRDFLRNFAKRDRVDQWYDFVDWGDAANFTLGQTNTGTNFTVIDGIGGVMAGTTANTATSSIWAIGKTRFAGNNNCMLEARFQIDTMASQGLIECGWVSAATTGASVVTDIDVPSYSGLVSNAAVFGQWQNQTHTNIAFASTGNFTSQTVASTLITTGFTSITSAVYVTVNVLLQTNAGETGKTKAYCWVNGRLRASHTAAAGAINGQTALYPWLFCQAVPTTSAKVMTVDYVWLSQDRAALSVALE